MKMYRFYCYGCLPWLVLLGSTSLQAQEGAVKPAPVPPAASAKNDATRATSAERYRDVLKAYQSAMQDFSALYSKAKTNEERSKLVKEKLPDRDAVAEKMLKIAEDAPEDSVAVEALVWVALNAFGPKGEKAMKVLIADHLKDPQIASLCPRMVYNNTATAEQFLREVLAKNPGREARGQACMALGKKLSHEAEDAGSEAKSQAMTQEAEALLERVTREFADIKDARGTLGDSAKNLLNALRNLGIGKTAPEIAGEDINGASLKLTGFRGKVVVLDFWGDW
jgi:hypothetical protein